MPNESKNLQELLAAISKDPSQPQADANFNAPAQPVQTSVATQVSNVPSVPNAAAPSSMMMPLVPNPPPPSNHYNSNLNELVNLLGIPARPPSTSAAPVPSLQQHRLPNFPPPPAVILPSAQQHTHKPPHAGLRKSAAAPGAKIPGGRRDAANQPVPGSIGQPVSSAPQKSASEITSGLTHAIASNPPASLLAPNALAQQQLEQQKKGQIPASQQLQAQQAQQAQQQAQQQRARQSQSSAHRPQQAAARAQGGQPARASNAPGIGRHPSATQQQLVAAANARRGGAAGGGGGRQITQEQVIVGHFCRHSIKLLSRVMQNKPDAAAAEQQLKDHIKKVWAQWVKSQITRPQLLDSVATFVCNTCPEAKNIDVIYEFKVWYEREFELQRQRNDAVRRSGTNASQPGQQPALLPPSANAGDLQNLQGAGVNRGQSAAIGLPKLGANMSFAGFQRNASKIPPALGKVKAEAILVSAKSKLEPNVSQMGGTAGKSVPNRGMPSRPGVGRGVGGKGTGKGFGKPGGGNAGAGRGGPVRGAGRKSVAGKSISRPPMMAKCEPTVVGAPGSVAMGNIGVGAAGTMPGEPGVGGIAGMSSFSGVTPAASLQGMSGIPPLPGNVGGAVARPGVAGKAVPAGKGLLGSKAPASASKGKGARKGFGKAAVGKGGGKGSPNSSKAKTPASPSMESGGGSSQMGITSVGEKRALDTSATSSPTPAMKKLKAGAKAPRAAPVKKKVPVVSSPVPGFPKGAKPPPARPDHLKNRAGNKPAPGALIHATTPLGAGPPPGLSPTVGHVRAVPPGSVPTPNAAVGSGVPKRAKRVDEELNVVTGVVDIEEEEDRLAMRADANEVVLVDENIYSEGMLLSGGRLRTKMQTVAKRFMLNENVGSDVMEMMSLAVEERLRYVLEKLKDSASIRTEARKSDWDVENDGPDMFEKLNQMREDEERALTVAAEMRVKRRNERKEAEAKKANGEPSNSEKKKESNATGDAERKEKLALEKKRKENRSQHDALFGLVEGRSKRGKRGNSSKLPPLESIGEIGSGKAAGGLGALPPIGRKTGLQSFGSSGSSKNKTLDRIEKLSKLGPLRKLGRHAEESEKDVAEVNVKEPLKLADCLFFMENEVDCRKSNLYCQWSARLGLR